MITLTVALPLALPDHALELGYVLSHDGTTIARQGLAPLSLLPKADTTILVVPAQKLSFHAISMPQAPKARLRAALDGLLEDRLLDATETQALALAPDAQARQATWVASCEKSWLQAHLAAFEQALFNTRRIVPQVWPQAERLLVATGTPTDPWLLRADSSGVLSSPLASAAFLCADLPEGAAILSPPEISQRVEKDLGHPVQLQSSAAALLASQESAWDLAQFDIRLGNSSAWGRRMGQVGKAFNHNAQWRWVRWGIAALLLAQVLGVVGLAWQETQRLAQKKALQTQLFAQTFPQIKVIIDPSIQMQRELDKLRASSSAPSRSDLETELAALAGVSSAAADWKAPISLQYASGNLTLKGVRLGPPAVAAVGDHLQAKGYQITFQDDTLTLKGKP